MSPDQLAFYSGWASLIGLAVSVASLAYVRSIKANIIKFQRKQRVRGLLDELEDICSSKVPWQPEDQAKLYALQRNLPRPWMTLGAKRRLLTDIFCMTAEAGKPALLEAFKDLRAYLEE